MAGNPDCHCIFFDNYLDGILECSAITTTNNMTDFAAIDFETANYNPSSICSVGVVIVRKGEIVEKLYRLIRPEPEWYSYLNTQIHGLTIADTKDVVSKPHFQPNFVNRTTSVADAMISLTSTSLPHFLSRQIKNEVMR